MKQFIRENPTLVFGLGLPLIIVAVFLIAAMLPALGATPPKYAVVFAANYYPNTRGLTINVTEKKAHVTYVGERDYSIIPTLYIYDATKNSLHEIRIILPPELQPLQAGQPYKESTKITPIRVPELEALTLDNSRIADDGYEFHSYDDYPRDMLLTGFFFGGSYHNNTVLKKGGYKVNVPNPPSEPYGSNLHFIGWVLAQ